MKNARIAIVLLIGIAPCAKAQPSFPIVDRATQRERDNDRRAILESEMAAERDALAKAEAGLNAGPTQEREVDIHRHMENVKALQRELNGVAGRPISHEPVRAVLKAVRPPTSVNTASTHSAPRFWDPYNRAPDTTDFSTTPRRELP